MNHFLNALQKVISVCTTAPAAIRWWLTPAEKKHALLDNVCAQLRQFLETEDLLSRAQSSGLRIRGRAMPDGVRGCYDFATNCITLNTAMLDDPEWAARALVHELRHWQQFNEGKISTAARADIRYDLMYIHAVEADAMAVDTIFAEAQANKKNGVVTEKIFTAEKLSRHFNDHLRQMAFYTAMVGTEYFLRYGRSGARLPPKGMDMAAIDRLHGMLVGGLGAQEDVYFMPQETRARFAVALLSSFNRVTRGVIMNPLRRFEKEVRPHGRSNKKDVNNLKRRASLARDNFYNFKYY
jgi:hypothetical protein